MILQVYMYILVHLKFRLGMTKNIILLYYAASYSSLLLFLLIWLLAYAGLNNGRTYILSKFEIYFCKFQGCLPVFWGTQVNFLSGSRSTSGRNCHSTYWPDQDHNVNVIFKTDLFFCATKDRDVDMGGGLSCSEYP